MSNIQSEKLLTRLIREWNARSVERDAEVALKKFVFSGDQISATPAMPGELGEHQEGKIRIAPNFGGLAVEKLSYLYAVPPQREGTDSEAWADVWDRHKGTMLAADRDIRLLGTSLAIAAAGPTITILPRDRWEAVKGAGSELSAVLYYDRAEVDEQGAKTHVYRYIDAEVWCEVLNVQEIFANDPMKGAVKAIRAMRGAQEHSAGMCPATTLKNTLDPNSVYGRPVGGKDFKKNLIALNRMFEEIVWTGALQRGQPVLKAGSKKTAAAISCEALAPDHLIKVDFDGDFFIVPNNANLDGQLLVYQVMLDTMARTLKLPRDAFAVKSIQPPSSAEMIRASDSELMSDRLLRVQIAEIWETEIMRIGAAVDPSLGTDVDVTFIITPPPITHAEKMNEERLFLDNKLMCRTEVLREMRPQWTPAELKRQRELAEAESEADYERAARVAGRTLDGREDPDIDDGTTDSDIAPSGSAGGTPI